MIILTRVYCITLMLVIDFSLWTSLKKISKVHVSLVFTKNSTEHQRKGISHVEKLSNLVTKSKP